jgi:copper chaperone CopZ
VDEELTWTVLVIIGMRDNTCRERISHLLGQVKGVTSVNVGLIRARAVIEHEPTCQPAELVWAVVEAGYGTALDQPGGRA